MNSALKKEDGDYDLQKQNTRMIAQGSAGKQKRKKRKKKKKLHTIGNFGQLKLSPIEFLTIHLA